MDKISAWAYPEACQEPALLEFTEMVVREFIQEKWLARVIPQQPEPGFFDIYDPSLTYQEIYEVGLTDQGVSKPMAYMLKLKSKRMRVVLAVMAGLEFGISRVSSAQ